MAWDQNLCPASQWHCLSLRNHIPLPTLATSSDNSFLLTDQNLTSSFFSSFSLPFLLLLFLILILFSFLLKCMSKPFVTLLASILHAMMFYNLSIVLCLLFYNKPQRYVPHSFAFYSLTSSWPKHAWKLEST